ncbi:MAG: DNA methyltransferase [Desulfurococcaceae archaeon]
MTKEHIFDKNTKTVSRKYLTLNNLSAKEWVKRTKSVWIESSMLKNFTTIEKAMETGIIASFPKKRDPLKRLHPATFAEEDIEKLIEFFTKEGDIILDPFLGSGSITLACIKTNRKCIGIELYPEWVKIAKQRLGMFNQNCEIYQGDALDILPKLPTHSIDFVIISPPYWGILSKEDHKTKQERLSKNLKKDYGNNEKDLSLIKDFNVFLAKLKDIFIETYRVLKQKNIFV